MRNKSLQEILKKYPDDMEVLIVYKGIHREIIEDDFGVYGTTANHCTYSHKWANEISYYSFKDVSFGYKDQIGVKLVDVELAMQTKDVVILEC